MLDHKVITFLEVVELKSYTAAARELGLTQPAVTQHIRKLEEFYGSLLIDSSCHSVRLTGAGEMLYQHLCMENTNQNRFLDKLKNLSKPLQIGATLSIADYYLPNALVGYQLEEGMNFSVLVANTETLTGKLLSGELDCAFVEGIFDGNLFVSHTFTQARFLPAAAVSHPLAGKEITLSDLHPFPLALREKGSGTRELLLSFLYQQNENLQSFSRILELGSFVLLKHLLSHSQAVSFVYEAVAAREVEEGKLCFLNLAGGEMSHPLHFIYCVGSPHRRVYESFYRRFFS